LRSTENGHFGCRGSKKVTSKNVKKRTITSGGGELYRLFRRTKGLQCGAATQKSRIRTTKGSNGDLLKSYGEIADVDQVKSMQQEKEARRILEEGKRAQSQKSRA